ncbi:MAG: N-acetylglucosamine-6-phosphate deacetylase [Clostridia bacterium]|nr:N-acetylglucosamine-6-phosphate deacetylase [Clostridia bacterium]
MILKNGLVMDKNFELKKLDIKITGEKIAEIGENLLGDAILDVNDKYILPGFIDTHIHGAYGIRIDDAVGDHNKITKFEATQGVTSIAITTDTAEFGKILEQLERATMLSKTCQGTKIVAIHAEGPFLSQSKKGAMSTEYILAPDNDKLDRMIAAGKGMLKLITITPDNDGSIEFIRYAKSKGLVVSMGHTDADFETAQAAIGAGATQLTHTFNAMRPINHREPGVLGAVFTNPDVKCEVICDYIHLHPAIVKMIYLIKGADKINMISDSGTAAGIEVSEFEVDGVKRYVKDGVVRLADGTIAGSARTLLDGVKNLVSSGIPLCDVSKMASFNPAKTLGIENETGSIEIGKYADLVVLDKDLNVENTFINGVCEYKG